LLTDRFIGDSQCANTSVKEYSVPVCVIRSTIGTVMRSTVDFNHEPLTRTVEVYDETEEAMLPPEFQPINSSATEGFPGPFFC
jgi:hypothetical protein